ncbi:MAG: hypothetical protein WBE79_14655 [Candidatus Cybelea sp.]|jgi:hypothetical protein
MRFTPEHDNLDGNQAYGDFVDAGAAGMFIGEGSRSNALLL